MSKFELGSIENPIKCDGPSGERAYLACLLGPDGQFLRFHREGSIPGEVNMLDCYRISSLDERFVHILYMDMYHKGFHDERLPEGFSRIADVEQDDFALLRKAGALEEELKEKFGGYDFGHFMYVYSKASRLCTCGPAYYAEKDFFQFPNMDFDLEALMHASTSFVEELRGLYKEHPLLVPNRRAVEEFLATFHFKADEPDKILGGGTFFVPAVHRMDGRPVAFWFKISS